MNIIQKIYSCQKTLSEDQLVDVIYKSFDDLYLSDNFEICNQILLDIDVEQLNLVSITAILSITLCCKSKLLARSDFYVKCVNRLLTSADVRIKNVNIFLRGLE